MTAKKKRPDGGGSVYQRHAEDCTRPTDARGKAKCKCKWQGALVIRFENGKPVRRKVSGTTESGTAAKLRDLDTRLRGDELPADGKPLTVEQWMTYWYKRIVPRTAKPYTIAGYNAKVNQYIIPILGHHRLDKLTPEHIDDAWDLLRDEGNPTKAEPTPLAPNTIHQTHRILAAALTVAVRRKKLRHNPAGRESMKAPPKIEQPIVPMTEDEVDKVLDTARGQWNSARWNVALAIGLRQGEALGLRWSDVDLEQGVVHVRQTLMRITGQGIVYGEPKSLAGRRSVVLPPSLLVALKAHRIEQTAARLEAGTHWTDSGLVFTLEDGRPIDPSVDAGRWRRLLEHAEVKHYRLHDARHSAGTMMVNQGVDIRTAMQILGHSQLSVTMRYQHVVDEAKKTAATQMDGAGRWA